MKRIIFVFAALALSVCRGEEPAAAINDAEVIGKVSDGKRPPKVEPKLPTLKVYSSREHQMKGHKMIMREIEKPPQIENRVPIQEPSREQLAARLAFQASPEFLRTQEEWKKHRHIMLSATVFDRKKTLLRWWHEGESYEAWSNFDWNHLSGFAEFKARGFRFSFMMGLGNSSLSELRNKQGEERQKQIPELPDLGKNGPMYLLIKGDEDNLDALLPIDCLHDLYEAEGERLKLASKERELEYKKRKEELERNPPVKPNSEINFWFGKGESR